MNNDLTNYYEFINEEMSEIATKRLRDAIHDIVVGLKPKEIIDVEDLSNYLLSDYKITISPFFLDKFLGEFMKSKRGIKSNTFFTRGDQRWLGVRDNKGSKEIRNNLLYQKPSLSKYKRKLYSEEQSQKLENAYLSGMKDLNFTEDVIKKTFILQKPEDSKEMMKNIYSDVVLDKKFHNTYENCWKLMILMGKQENLDRVTHYFKLAPQSVKDHYKTTGRVDLELKRVEKTTGPVKKQTTTKQTTDKKTEPPQSRSNTTEDNLVYLGEKIKAENWGSFIETVGLSELINLINGLKVVSKHSEFEMFLSKIDELFTILRKYYQVEKGEIIKYFKYIGLARYVRMWEESKVKPKINDF